MQQMLPQEDKNLTLKRELIEGTIDTVATLGLENTTTNAICTTCNINVAYIYRFFADKEDLIAKAFGFVDEQFLRQILDNYTVLNYESIDYESRCRVLFKKCWDYLMAHPKDITFYTRYYYSVSFQKYAYTEHMKRYVELFEKMKTAFPESTDIRLILHHILDTLLGQATKQIENPTDDSDIAATKTFFLIFSVIKSYLRTDRLNSNQ